MVVGGADSVCRWAYAGLYRIGALVAERCAPVDRDRAGVITAEGGVALFLESLDSAHIRRALRTGPSGMSGRFLALRVRFAGRVIRRGPQWGSAHSATNSSQPEQALLAGIIEVRSVTPARARPSQARGRPLGRPQVWCRSAAGSVAVG